MTGLGDSRRLRVFSISSIDGELGRTSLCDVWQDIDGNIKVSNGLDGLMVASPEDLLILSKRKMISPLELLRKMLSRIPMLVVEVA